MSAPRASRSSVLARISLPHQGQMPFAVSSPYAADAPGGQEKGLILKSLLDGKILDFISPFQCDFFCNFSQ